MSNSSVCTKTHAFSTAGTDSTIDGTAGRQEKQLFKGRQKIQSLKISNNQTTPMQIDFYDGAGTTAYNGKLIHRVHVAVRENIDCDFHGSLVNDGLYVLVTGAGTKVNVSVSAQYN
jgi:hypothetical protein